MEQEGWDAEVAFVVQLVNALLPDGNSADIQLGMYQFSKKVKGVGAGNVDANVPVAFGASRDVLTQALNNLTYKKIVNGATDHPQVFLTVADAFNTYGRPSAEKVLILVTDGVTHQGEGCTTLDHAVAEEKIGVCEGDHVCVGQGCDPVQWEKCMCGLYNAALFKEQGFTLKIVGVANKHHVVESEADVFQNIMAAMVSPGNHLFSAEDFTDLSGLVPNVTSSVCHMPTPAAVVPQ